MNIEFVGQGADYLAEFQEMLLHFDQTKGFEHKAIILHGLPGAGKTEICYALEALCASSVNVKCVHIDWSNSILRTENFADVLHTIAMQILGAADRQQIFDREYDRFLRHYDDVDPSLLVKYQSDPVELAHILAEQDAEWHRDPFKWLSNQLSVLGGQQQGGRVLILDSYERIEHFEPWLVDYIVRRLERTLFVISSEVDASQSWNTRPGRPAGEIHRGFKVFPRFAIRVWPLGLMSEKQVALFLERNQARYPLAPQQKQDVLEAVKGREILLGDLLVILEASCEVVTWSIERMIQRILGIIGAEDRTLFELMSILRNRSDFGALAAALSVEQKAAQSKYEELVARHPGLFEGDGFYWKPRRDIVNQYILPSLQDRIGKRPDPLYPMIERIVQYYRSLIDLSLAEMQCPSNTWEESLLDLLNALFWHDPSQGMQLFVEQALVLGSRPGKFLSRLTGLVGQFESTLTRHQRDIIELVQLYVGRFIPHLILDASDIDRERLLKEHCYVLEQLGNQLYGRGRLQEALDIFDRAMEQNPRYYPILYCKAQTLRQLGRLEEAETLFRLCVEYKPNDPAAHRGLAVIFRRTDRFDDAFREFNEALQYVQEGSNEWADIVYSLGYLHHKLGQLEEAKKTYLRAKEVLPDWDAPIVRLGLIYLEEGDLRIARVNLQHAIHLLRQVKNIFSGPNIALCQLGLGNADEAMRELKKTKESDGVHPGPWECVRDDAERLLPRAEEYEMNAPKGRFPSVDEIERFVKYINDALKDIDADIDEGGDDELTFDSQRVYALVIGVASYRHMRPLAKTNADARELYDVLLRNGYLPANMTLLLDEQATKSAISDKLGWLARRAEPNDTVVIFFSGHGAQIVGGFWPGEYLCPMEAALDKINDTLISNEDFTNALQSIHAGQLVIFLDACHAGGVGEAKDLAVQVRAGLSTVAYNRLAQGQGRVIIASCKPDEVSWEPSEIRNGLFTHYLLEGLRGEAAREDGTVWISNLFGYVYEHVSLHDPQRYPQHPFQKSETEDFIIAMTRQPHTY